MKINQKIKRLQNMLADKNWPGLFYALRKTLGFVSAIDKNKAFFALKTKRNSCVKKVSNTFFSAPNSAHSKLNILFVSHDLKQEGAPRSLKELAEGLKHHERMNVKVLAFEDGPLRQDYEKQGIHVTVFPLCFDRLSTLHRLDLEIEKISVQLKSSGAHLVLANTLRSFPALWAAEQAGLTSLWIIRESEPWNRVFNLVPEDVAQKAITSIQLPAKVIFVSEATRSVWKDLENGCRFEVIPNALNPSRFHADFTLNKNQIRQEWGWKDQEIVFLCVGTVIERKGQKDILEASKKLSSTLHTPIRIVLLGDISNSYAKKTKCNALKFKKSSNIQIDFFDSIDSIGKYYKAADAFIHCARVESYPRVILEAMTFGLPIITTPVFGIKEQLQDEDALFYTPGDVNTLRHHMQSLTQSESTRHQFSLQSTKRLKSLSTFNQMIHQYATLIRQTINFH